jgi:hypothetical protein
MRASAENDGGGGNSRVSFRMLVMFEAAGEDIGNSFGAYSE